MSNQDKNMGEHLEQILDAYWFMAQQGKVEVQRPASVAAIEALIRRCEAEAVREFAERVKEQVTYAQWVIEREEPKNLDKEVVMVKDIDAELQRLQGE